MPRPPCHELNNLLGKILGAAELALDAGPEAEVAAELQLIIELAEAAAGVVRGLDEARPEPALGAAGG